MRNLSGKKIVALNIFSNFFLQFVTIVSGFVVPRIILTLFGSETNGLISSLTQFLSYVNLIEGGIGGVIAASLYKPLVEKDDAKLSAIIAGSKKVYRQLGILILIFSLGLSIFYPLFSNSSFSFGYISSMALIIAFQMFMQYLFAIPYQQLLRYDKKIYMVSFIQSIFVILNLIIFVVVSKFLPDIHLLKLLSALVFIVQPILLSKVTKKYYKLDKTAKPDQELMQNRWDGFSINLAYFIHTSTDVSVLTIFTNLATVSVYTVHAVVTNGIRKILFAISTAVSPNLGHIYAKGDKKALREKFDLVDFIYFAISAFLLTVTGLLIVPFTTIYTKSVTDANYFQPLFAILLVIAEFFYCVREPYYNLAQAAGRFKDMKKVAYIEAGINLILSIILVNFVGLIGVAIGTLLGNLYRTIWHVIYFKDHVLHRSPMEFFKKCLIFGISSALAIVVCFVFLPMSGGILSFITHGALYALIIALFYLAAALIFYKKELKSLKLLK